MDALQEENEELKRANSAIKNDLQRLKFRYDKLKGLYVSAVKKTIETQLKLKEVNMMSKIATNFAAYFNQLTSDDEDVELEESVGDGLYNSKTVPYQPEKINHFEKIFEQFIIIEPSLVSKQFQPCWSYPNCGVQSLEQIRRRLVTFIFPDGVSMTEIEDDCEQSHKNEIIFGSQGQFLEFILENDIEANANSVLCSLNRKRKYYCYVYIKPHIMVTQPKYISVTARRFLESERAFCFISKFPFIDFFNNLNKSIQQTVKLLHLSDKPIDSIRKDYNVINKILKKIFDTKVTHFPIDRTWKTEVSEARLKVDSEELVLLNVRKYFFDNSSSKLNSLTISKLIHYCLIECHLLVFTQNKEFLNDLLGLMRSIIYPLQWEFGIIYTMTEELLPFLEAPFPIMVGVNKGRTFIQQSGWSLAPFVIFDADQGAFLNDQESLKIIDSSCKKLAADLHKQKPQSMLRVVISFMQDLIKTLREESPNPAKLSDFQRQVMQSQAMTSHLST